MKVRASLALAALVFLSRATVCQQAVAAQPVRDAAGVYKVGHGVLPPTVIHTVDPVFSEPARKKRLGGTCNVSIVVDANGRVHDARVVRSTAEDNPPKLKDIAYSLDAKAVEAVNQYRFTPGTYQGKPVSTMIFVEVSFQMR